MTVQGAGAPGTIAADVAVRFEEREDGTAVSYDADAVVGGMLGGVGQRMLGSVSKRMAAEFFGNVDEALAGGGAAEAEGAAAGSGRFVPSDGAGGDRAMPGVYVDAARARPDSAGGFLQGVAVGAGLVLLGVAAGVVAGRVGGRRG
jgi:hypothetical protein